MYLDALLRRLGIWLDPLDPTCHGPHVPGNGIPTTCAAATRTAASNGVSSERTTSACGLSRAFATHRAAVTTRAHATRHGTASSAAEWLRLPPSLVSASPPSLSHRSRSSGRSRRRPAQSRPAPSARASPATGRTGGRAACRCAWLRRRALFACATCGTRTGACTPARPPARASCKRIHAGQRTLRIVGIGCDARRGDLLHPLLALALREHHDRLLRQEKPLILR